MLPEQQPFLQSAMKKERLDRLVLARGLAPSREQAQRLIMAGEIEVNGVRADKPGHLVDAAATIAVRQPLPYVSRGGVKLAAALDAFVSRGGLKLEGALSHCGIDPTGQRCLDVGQSTGGFTDCLLQRGAACIYAVDVGYGQLAWKLRTDPKVVVLDRTNVRYLEALPGGVQANLAVIDASFIGLALVLPAALRLLSPEGQIVALVKPQFEAGAADVGKGGVVREPAVHRRVLHESCTAAETLGLHVAGLITSPALGPAGNVEFLLWLTRTAPPRPFAREPAITAALAAAESLRRRPAS
jgi:23S rRNA (cytidine1920-2'-O)/16S rRNA (cytidine1409-2'-O)-methyltransferase